MEALLLARASVADDGPFLVDAMLVAKSVPAEGDDAGAVQFAPPAGFAVPDHVVAAINSLLARAPARYPGDQQLEALTAELAGVLDAAGAPGVATAAAALAALALVPIRHEFDSPRAQRFHHGYRGLLRAVEIGLVQLDSVSVPWLRAIAHALSRLRPTEYTNPAWETLTNRLVALGVPLARGADDVLRLSLVRFRERLARAESTWARNSVAVFDAAFGIATGVPLELGERWSDQAFTDLLAMDAGERSAWLRLIVHGTTVRGSTPSARWTKIADESLPGLDRDRVLEYLRNWFVLVGKPRPPIAGGRVSGRDASVPTERASGTLRGLAFLAGRFDTPAAALALGDLAMACFKMVQGVGARCIRPGTAALHCLARMTTREALAQLSRLRQLVKFGTARKMLDASLERLAANLSITVSELHEMAAPDFGLDRSGRLREEAGVFTLEVAAHTGGATVRVLDEQGRERKSVPAVVKQEHAELWKACKQLCSDVDKTLEGQRARLDAMFVDGRFWSVPVWRERYIEHPLVGVLGRRLIWRLVDDFRASVPGRAILWRDDSASFADLDGAAVTPGSGQYVRLWHPIDASAQEVQTWRECIEGLGYRQPVKQAHREVYPLTDAELRTETYSNRFAAHVLKQHAFQELAAARGWISQLRLMVDASYAPPLRELPGWNLRAEFWVESLGDEFGRDTTPSGSYLYLTTDQVRFYRSTAAQASVHAAGGGYVTRGPDEAANHPLPLASIPPLVFSEMMRDVDLFVGGASVGADPRWQDGGPGGRFLEYWRKYGLAELGSSGTARRELLQRLVPKLAIAGACTFEDKFLVVRGKLRTYRIHLGSGNILMDPNDQYLCIVPNARDELGSALLPFEGDRMTSIVLSKALLLAEDDRIKDPSITRQIRGS